MARHVRKVLHHLRVCCRDDGPTTTGAGVSGANILREWPAQVNLCHQQQSAHRQHLLTGGALNLNFSAVPALPNQAVEISQAAEELAAGK